MYRTFTGLALAALWLGCGPPCMDDRCSAQPSTIQRQREANEHNREVAAASNPRPGKPPPPNGLPPGPPGPPGPPAPPPGMQGSAAPGQPAPGQSAPGQPAPGQSAPGQPAPGQPAPGQPAPPSPTTPIAGKQGTAYDGAGLAITYSVHIAKDNAQYAELVLVAQNNTRSSAAAQFQLEGQTTGKILWGHNQLGSVLAPGQAQADTARALVSDFPLNFRVSAVKLCPMAMGQSGDQACQKIAASTGAWITLARPE